MTTRLAAVALSCVLIAAGAEHDVRKSLSKLPRGRRIEVVSAAGEKLVGKMGTVSAEGFRLDPDKRGGIVRDMRFDEVQSVRSKWTRAEKWMIGVLIYLGFVGLIALTVGG